MPFIRKVKFTFFLKKKRFKLPCKKIYLFMGFPVMFDPHVRCVVSKQSKHIRFLKR
jgi:hypothetical protein